MMDYWMSTKSPVQMFRQDYETPEGAALLRESVGVDPAMLVSPMNGLSPAAIRAWQRRLGLRKVLNSRDKDR